MSRRLPQQSARSPLQSAALVALACLAGVAAHGAVLWVALDSQPAAPYDTRETGLRSIQAAVDAAQAGDTVRVAAGTYTERITVPRSLTIEGEGMASSTLDGAGGGSCVTVQAGAALTLRLLALRNGKAESGGGLFALNADAELDRVLVADCQAGRGGGIYLKQGYLRLSACVIEYCRALESLATSGGKGAASIFCTARRRARR